MVPESTSLRNTVGTSVCFLREPMTLSPGILVVSVSSPCMYPQTPQLIALSLPFPSSPGAVTCFNSPAEENAFFRDTIVRSINYTIAGKFDQQDQDELFSRTDEDSNLLLEFGKRCQQGPVGKYLQYAGTTSTVRDLVTLGDCLVGEGKPIDYWGFSYGTVIGANFLNSESRIQCSHVSFLNIRSQCFQK